MAEFNPPAGALFRAFEEREFGFDHCFLCGAGLTEETRSNEHVVPRWLQDRFGLWNERLTLLNATTIPYRQLVIPCCKTCNNVYLGQIEAAVQAAADRGAEAVRALEPSVLFLWLAKILYGLLHREFLLPLDRRVPEQGPIVPREVLEEYEMHHFFLQGARLPIRFDSGLPASIFVYELQSPPELSLQFDFRDNPYTLCLSIRLANIGILAALQDGGAQAAIHSDDLNRFREFPLHPLQFIELSARFFYKAGLLNRVPKFLIGPRGDHLAVFQMPLGGLSAKPIFDTWDYAAYAQVLSEFTGYPLERIFVPPDKVMQWLNDQEGIPRFMDLRAHPWP